MRSYTRTIIILMQYKKQKLQTALGKVVKELRKNKSISRLSNEIDLSKSVWADLEQGKKDIQLSTFWRIAEALDVSQTFLINMLEEELGKDFTFLED